MTFRCGKLRFFEITTVNQIEKPVFVLVSELNERQFLPETALGNAVDRPPTSNVSSDFRHRTIDVRSDPWKVRPWSIWIDRADRNSLYTGAFYSPSHGNQMSKSDEGTIRMMVAPTPVENAVAQPTPKNRIGRTVLPIFGVVILLIGIVAVWLGRLAFPALEIERRRC